jgi:hypothetical protein
VIKSNNIYLSEPQLIVVMVGKQVLNNIVEFLVPKVVHLWKSYVYR